MDATRLPFRVAPLGCLLAAAALMPLLGSAWSTWTAAGPWLVSLVFVGLPHGAADLAVSRRLCGWPATLRLFSVYGAVMLAVVAALLLAPRLTVVSFAALSIWHFGQSHAEGQSPPHPASRPWQAVAAVARGASVLGVPLAVWPVETAAVITRLLTLVRLAGNGPPAVFSAEEIHTAGICLTLTAITALALEAVVSCRTPGALRRSGDTLVDLLVIGVLGACVNPLLSIGLYFLCWHAWREMRPLTTVIGRPAGCDQPAAGLAALVRDVAAVHVAAIPLLIPTWAALAVAWWLLSPSHTMRDLAILSLAVYVVVTPPHEALHDILRAGSPLRSRLTCPTGAWQPPSLPFRQPAHSCTARSASS